MFDGDLFVKDLFKANWESNVIWAYPFERFEFQVPKKWGGNGITHLALQKKQSAYAQELSYGMVNTAGIAHS